MKNYNIYFKNKYVCISLYIMEKGSLWLLVLRFLPNFGGVYPRLSQGLKGSLLILCVVLLS